MCAATVDYTGLVRWSYGNDLHSLNFSLLLLLCTKIIIVAFSLSRL